MSWINTLRTSAEDLGTLAENEPPTFLSSLLLFSVSWSCSRCPVPEALRVALLARGLDQPGVLVAFVEDILEECATTAPLGTGIAVNTPPIVVPISIVLSSSASSSAPLLSLASGSSVPSGKRVRSRKVEKSRVIKKNVEVDEGELPSVVESGRGEAIEIAVVRKE